MSCAVLAATCNPRCAVLPATIELIIIQWCGASQQFHACDMSAYVALQATRCLLPHLQAAAVGWASAATTHSTRVTLPPVVMCSSTTWRHTSTSLGTTCAT
jgi:hypothetical protein